MPQARLELLGGYTLISSAGEPIPLSARKPRALLAYLALAPGRAHSRERLAALLWGDSSELQARTSLRQALTALRRTFEPGGADVIAADAAQVSLAPGSLAVDVAEFERAVDLEAAESLQRALQLYRGDLLDGFGADSPAFEQWLVAERERLRTLAVKGLAALIAYQRAAGLTEQALETAARLVALDPLREEAQRDLIRLYAQQGRMVEALKQYQLLRQVLARELGVAPTPETEQLYRDILLQRRSVSVTEAQPAPEAAAAQGAAPAQVRHAIVLLTDLHGFTAFAGETDPEQVHHYLLAYRARIAALVRHHGGVVTNYIGARVMAAFGVPVAHDDDAERAVRTALAIRAEVPDLPVPGGMKLLPQVGLASGGLFADGAPGELVISGEPVSMAARIMEQAGPGEVFCSGWVRQALGDRLQAEPMPTVAIRAAARPVQVWRVVQWLEWVPSLRPFVGRQLELRQLAGLVESCLASRSAHVLLVRGEAGIGKTRLLEELARTARARNFAWHRVMVLDFGGGAGGSPIPALVRALLGVTERGRVRAVAAVERAVADGRVERDTAPFVFGMLELDAPVEYASGVPIEGAARQRAAQSVLAGLIRARSAESPLLLVVEDIHWADEATLETLARAVAAARASPVVLGLSTRPEGDPIGAAWRAACAGCPLVTLDLGPLSAKEAHELAASYHVQDEALVASCLRRAEGNPLFIDQLLRGAQSGSEVLPSTVQSIVLARLDRIEPAQRQGLQAASVLGQRFTLEAAQHLLGGTPFACGEEMVEKGLVRPDGEGYLFSHALIHQAVYASLLRSRRHELHRRAAQWFEPRDAALHAEHLDAAGDPGAAQAYARAAKTEAERHQQERALRLAQRGLALAQDRALRYELAQLGSELLRELGRSEESLQASRDALALAATPGEKAQALFGVASALRILDRPDEALRTVEQAEAYASETGDPAELAQLYFLRGNLYFPLGEIDACLAAHQRARAYAEAAGSPVLEARALGSLGDAHYLRGEMLTAHDYFRRCVALSQERMLLGVAATCLPMVGITHLYRNELEAAVEACRAGADLARRTGNLRAELVGLDVLATLHVFAMRWDEAFEAATHALEMARRLGARRFEADALGMLGFALTAQGEQARGERTLEDGYEVAREIGVRDTGPWLLGSLARVTREPAKRQAALEQGEKLLAEGCVSHSHLHFYENAIDACLDANEPERVERYVAALRDYTKREPMPWSELHVRRGTALARCARGERTPEVRAELEAIAREAHHAGLLLPLVRVEEALAGS